MAPSTVQANLKTSLIIENISFARGHESVSVCPYFGYYWLMAGTDEFLRSVSPETFVKMEKFILFNETYLSSYVCWWNVSKTGFQSCGLVILKKF